MDSDSFFLSSSEFSGRVAETIKDVYKSEKFTDVTLITEDLRETRAHRLVLISGSKVLCLTSTIQLTINWNCCSVRNHCL